MGLFAYIGRLFRGGYHSDHEALGMSEKERTWCVPSSIFNAWVWQAKRKAKTDIAIFNLEKGIDHAQARFVMKNGVYQYLTEIWDGESMAAIPYGKNHPKAKEPYRIVGLRAFINEQLDLIDMQDREEK